MLASLMVQPQSSPIGHVGGLSFEDPPSTTSVDNCSVRANKLGITEERCYSEACKMGEVLEGAMSSVSVEVGIEVLQS
ncbi:hypothetical protein AGIG_G10911 [Arapaima gigas]